MLRIILLFSIFLIGCVSTGKYEELKNSCEQKEKTCQEELKLEKEKFAKLLEEQKNEIAKLTENHNNELKVKQEKYNDLLRQKLSLRTSINQMEGSVDELSQEKANLEKQKQEMEQALEELRKRKEESEARVTEFKGLLDKFKAFIDTGKLKIKIIDGRMVIVLSSDVLFASGSKVLSTNGKKAVAEVTEILAIFCKSS